MSKIVIYTQAHNSEKTLRRTLDSVLNQSFQDFTYYVGDNCSADGTHDIIWEYAAKDPRIRPIYYDVDDKTGSGFWRILCSIEHIRKAADFEWLCILDSDDVYDPEFLKEMLGFSARHHLDMAACGSRFIRPDNEQQLGARSVPHDLIVSGAEFGTYFPLYHQFMRTLWAKLICRSAVEQADFASLGENRSVGADTRLAFEFLRHCRRFGISAKLLHSYSYSPSSASYRLDAKRIGADALQHKATIHFLKEKADALSPENQDFLYKVYYNAVVDTLNVLLKASNAAPEEKLSGLRELLSTDVTLEMLQSDAVAIDKRRELLRQLLTAIEGLVGRDTRYEDAIWLGLTITALLGEQDKYVRYSKLQIRFLLDADRQKEAEAQLEEWESILPDDPELKAMRTELPASLPEQLIILGPLDYIAVAAGRFCQSKEGPKILAMCDISGQHCGKQAKLPSGRIPIINFEELVQQYRKNPKKTGVFLAVPFFQWNAALDILRNYGIENIYGVPAYAYQEKDQEFQKIMFPVPLDLPMLIYYEYHTTEHCNLNCYQCGNYSNLISKPVMGNLEQYKKDVKRLAELFWNVGEIRFQGGEPLLNPDLPEFMRVTREAFPYANIGILSNGLLIPKAAPELFEAMRKYHLFIWLSGYPPTYKILDQIQSRCDTEKIPVSIMPPIQEWREESVKTLEMPPSNDWAAAEKWWRTCGAQHSHFLCDGYLYYCCFTNLNLPVLYERLGRDIRKNHMWQHLGELRFDLSDPSLDGWTINKKLNHVHETCLYCVNRWPNFRTVPWRTCPPNQVEPKDYLWEPPGSR